MFRAEIDINKEEYLACNRYYLRRYVGIKEIILVSVLVAMALALFFAFQQWLILAFCGVVLVLLIVVLIIFIAMGNKMYREEFVKRNTHKWVFVFGEEEYQIETHEENGEKTYVETRTYNQVDRIALLKDKMYFYTSPATIFYIRRGDVEENKYDELVAFLKKKINPVMFSMKQKRWSQYPKNIFGPRE